MKKKIEGKLAKIVNFIIEKDTSTITKEDYDILAAERQRIVWEEEQQRRAKKLTESMADLLGSSIGCAFNGPAN